MDGIDIVNIGMRPCVVTHRIKCMPKERKAIFHMWTKSMITKGEDISLLQTLAIVEYEDGTIGQVKPKNLRFTDNLVSDYFSILEAQNEENTEE